MLGAANVRNSQAWCHLLTNVAGMPMLDLLPAGRSREDLAAARGEASAPAAPGTQLEASKASRLTDVARASSSRSFFSTRSKACLFRVG